jgi:hypothetical protein
MRLSLMDTFTSLSLLEVWKKKWKITGQHDAHARSHPTLASCPSNTPHPHLFTTVSLFLQTPKTTMTDEEQSPEQPQEEMMQVHPATRQLMSLHVPPSDLQKYLDRVDYLGSRGLSGLGALKNYLGRHKRRAAKAKDPKKELEWFTLAPLHGACMNGHVGTTLPYIYETMNASLNTLNKEGNTPLHQSVIWGRNACVVWLLEKGCDITVLNKVGDNALEMAIKRQAKLNDPELQSKRLSQLDRDKLLREGVDLINILKGVSEAPDYQYWAKHNPRHALVIEYSPWSKLMDNRVQLMLLRELVLAHRAVMLTKAQVQAGKDAEEERLARAQHDRAQNIASQASKVVYPELKAAMTKDLGHLDMTGDAVSVSRPRCPVHGRD